MTKVQIIDNIFCSSASTKFATWGDWCANLLRLYANLLIGINRCLVSPPQKKLRALYHKRISNKRRIFPWNLVFLLRKMRSQHLCLDPQVVKGHQKQADSIIGTYAYSSREWGSCSSSQNKYRAALAAHMLKWMEEYWHEISKLR